MKIFIENPDQRTRGADMHPRIKLCQPLFVAEQPQAFQCPSPIIVGVSVEALDKRYFDMDYAAGTGDSDDLINNQGRIDHMLEGTCTENTVKQIALQVNLMDIAKQVGILCDKAINGKSIRGNSPSACTDVTDFRIRAQFLECFLCDIDWLYR